MVSKLTVPLVVVCSIIIALGGTIVAALDREAEVKSSVATLKGEVDIMKGNAKRLENDIASFQIEIRRTDRVMIGIEKKLEYLVEKVDDISEDVKEHKRKAGD